MAFQPASRALHDVVIVGGGVVGSLLGCLLAERLPALSLAVIEPAPPRAPTRAPMP